MHYRTIAAICLALTFVFGAVSGALAQEGEKQPAPKEEPKKDAPKEEPKKDPAEEPKKVVYLTHKEFDELMDKSMKAGWGKVRQAVKNKKGEDAQKAADELAKMAAKILLCDDDVKEGENKGKKLRDQKDFQGWANDIKAAAEELSKQAKDGKWDKAEAEKDKIGKACGSCHDVYQPKKEK